MWVVWVGECVWWVVWAEQGKLCIFLKVGSCENRILKKIQYVQPTIFTKQHKNNTSTQ